MAEAATRSEPSGRHFVSEVVPEQVDLADLRPPRLLFAESGLGPIRLKQVNAEVTTIIWRPDHVVRIARVHRASLRACECRARANLHRRPRSHPPVRRRHRLGPLQSVPCAGKAVCETSVGSKVSIPENRSRTERARSGTWRTVRSLRDEPARAERMWLLDSALLSVL